MKMYENSSFEFAALEVTCEWAPWRWSTQRLKHYAPGPRGPSLQQCFLERLYHSKMKHCNKGSVWVINKNFFSASSQGSSFSMQDTPYYKHCHNSQGVGSCTWVNDVGLEGCEEHGAEPHSCVHTSNNFPFAETKSLFIVIIYFKVINTVEMPLKITIVEKK